MPLYLTPVDDMRQDAEIGDFRGRARTLVDSDASVLEIGPSYMPLFPKREGYKTTIIDHADAPVLREKYRSIGVDPSAIEEVDLVWQGGSLSVLTRGKKFDFIYASHVIEHMTDIVRFLNDCESIVAKGGSIILLVPDKRYCFDVFQPVTDTAKAISDFLRNKSVHTAESLYREESQVSVDYEGKDVLAWWQRDVSALRMMRHDAKGRLRNVFDAEEKSDYVDAHEYFFTPSSFLLLIRELEFLGLCNLSVETLTRARGCEFLVVLKQAGKQRSNTDFAPVKRELSLNILREHQESWKKLKPLSDPFDFSVL